MSPALKGEFAVQPLLPLEIKLHLERMKLMELIRSTGETTAPSFARNTGRLLNCTNAADARRLSHPGAALIDELKAARSVT